MQKKHLIFTAFTLFLSTGLSAETPKLKVAVMYVPGASDLDSQCILKGFSVLDPVAKKSWDVTTWEYEIDPASTKATTEKILATKPDVIFGPEYSQAAVVTSQMANINKIPFISALASMPEVTEGRPYAARFIADATYLGGMFARLVTSKLKPKELAIIVNLSNNYSTFYANVMERKLKASTPKIRSRRFEILGDHANFDDLAKKIVAAKSTVIYTPIYSYQGGTLANALTKLHWNGKILAHGFSYTGDFLSKNHPAIIYNADINENAPTSLRADFDKIIATYCPAVAASPVKIAGITYDALKLLSDITESSPTLRGIDLVTSYRTSSFTGLSGRRKFSKDHVTMSMSFFEFAAGKANPLIEYKND